jgi:hypothetical protein
MLSNDACIRFERPLYLVRRFAVLTGWQHTHDFERWQTQSGAELQLEEVWATEMINDVVAGPVSRHERYLPPPENAGFLLRLLLCRRA